MLIDAHVHLAGTDTAVTGNYMDGRLRRSLWMRLYRRRLGLANGSPDAATMDQRVLARTLGWMKSSSINRFVLLALDGVHSPEGRLDLASTRVMVSNDYIASLAARHDPILFGASIHPFRRDALDEVRRCFERGACLIKWIPSAQRFEPDDPACLPFYRLLAELGLPLLTHMGPEHTLPGANASANDPARLRPALELGVTVIGAHCGARLYLHERDRFPEWVALTRQYPNLYGDTSAFCVPTRAGPLRRLLSEPALQARLIYGSDFPAIPFPLSFLLLAGWKGCKPACAVDNPFDKPLLSLQGAGLHPDVFNRASTILRIPPSKRDPLTS
jgi:predicted TIM-barrel fold metal-dependent hydrolase